MKNKCDDYGMEEISRLTNKVYNLIKLKDKIDKEIEICTKSLLRSKESCIKSGYDLSKIKFSFIDLGWELPNKENV